MNFFRTITFRITLWYLIILSVLLTLFGTGVYFTLSKVLYANLDRNLQKRAVQITEFRDVMSIVAGGTFEDQAGEYISFFYYDRDRLKDISTRGKTFSLTRETIDRAMSGERILSTRDIPGRGLFRVYIRSFIPDDPVIRPDRFSSPVINEAPPRKDDDRLEDRPRRDDRDHREPAQNTGRPKQIEIKKAALVVARPLGDIVTVLNLLLAILICAIPLTVMISAGCGVFLARRALKPVERITDTAKKIGETDLSHRIEVHTRDELGHLAGTLNKMIERLDKAFKREKEFTSDASHELRAPLAIIQAEATLALGKDRSADEYRKTLETIAGETENMSRLANTLLELARSDSGKSADTFETVNLDCLIQDACLDMEMLFQEKSIALQTKLADPVRIMGDPSTLKQLVMNLLNNALRYTKSGGRVTVALVRKHAKAVITVSDTGIGIPEHELPHIFKRFYRVNKARTRKEGGFGLGLAICKHIVEAHKGTITAESLPEKGTSLTIRFPEVG